MSSKNKNNSTFPENSGDNPFRVPNGYFEELPGRIRDRLASEENPRSKRTLPLNPVLAWAAAVALLLLVGYLAVNTFLKPTNPMPEMSEMADAVEYYISDFDEVEILEAISEADESIDTISVDEETIIEYLQNEEIHLSEIIEQL